MTAPARERGAAGPGSPPGAPCAMRWTHTPPVGASGASAVAAVACRDARVRGGCIHPETRHTRNGGGRSNLRPPHPPLSASAGGRRPSHVDHRARLPTSRGSARAASGVAQTGQHEGRLGATSACALDNSSSINSSAPSGARRAGDRVQNAPHTTGASARRWWPVAAAPARCSSLPSTPAVPAATAAPAAPASAPAAAPPLRR